MNYYKVNYQYSDRGEYLYPSNAHGVVWSKVHYHFTECSMIGETEQALEEDGDQVKKLAKKDAMALIKEYAKTFPQPPEDDTATMPE